MRTSSCISSGKLEGERLIPVSIKQNHPIRGVARSAWPISKSESRNTRGGGRKEEEEEEGRRKKESWRKAENREEKSWRGRLMPKLKPMNRFARGNENTVRKGRFTLENFLLIF